MNARDLLADLAGAGVSVTAAGEALVIRPASRLTDVMRRRLRAAKPELLALLGGSPDAEAGVLHVPDVLHPAFKRETPDRTGWRDYFEERAAIREHDGGVSRSDAEAGAFADCVARWRALHPLPASGDGACVHCGKAPPDTPVLAHGGHAWLHRECWAPMNADRNEMARQAVGAALGLPRGGAGS